MRAGRLAIGLWIGLAATSARPDHVVSQVPEPASVLGFEPGTDSLLADWSQINRYLSALAGASDLAHLDTIGTSTLGRPLLLLTVTSASNHARADRIREVQYQLAHPGDLSLAPAAIDSQPAVVLVNNNIHSTEIASSLFGLELAHRLVTWDKYTQLLDSIVVLMIPSTNPDGLDTVVSWYRQYAGTRYEAGPLPWLYHPYAGHDNNRDWFMVSQTETRAISRVLYREWFPEVVWDVHQMGREGPRFFLPPFADPVNPNLDPILVGATNLVGTAMTTALQDSGLAGLVNRERFDLWWHGGFRTVPARHNMIGILSEAASAGLASPIQTEPDTLPRSSSRPDPWPGGTWRIGDIIRYELIAADGLIGLVGNNKRSFIDRFVTLGLRAIEAGRNEGPRAYLIPPVQRDRFASRELQRLLLEAGITLEVATADFEAEGTLYPRGTVIIPLDQPFRAHVKDLFDVQRYPASDGARPYDTAGWTLPLQMGVAVVTVTESLTASTDPIAEPVNAGGEVVGTGGYAMLSNRSVGESSAIAAALVNGATVSTTLSPVTLGHLRFPRGAVILSGTGADSIVRSKAAQFGFDAALTDRPPEAVTVNSSPPRIGILKMWTAGIDEGWTRWVFESFGIPYSTVRPGQLRSGALDELEVLVVPAYSNEIFNIPSDDDRRPSGFATGLDAEAIGNLRDFVTSGRTLVTLGAASRYAISALQLPVVDLATAADSNESSRFLASGSIFGVNIGSRSAVTSGMPPSFSVYFRDGGAFRTEPPAVALVTYSDDPLQSGHLGDPELIAGAGALVEVPVGRGRVILFGFRPQHRGQTFGTFKTLFNAVLLTGPQ